MRSFICLNPQSYFTPPVISHHFQTNWNSPETLPQIRFPVSRGIRGLVVLDNEGCNTPYVLARTVARSIVHTLASFISKVNEVITRR